MCGILGAVSEDPVDGEEISKALNVMRSRGPDDEGYRDIDSGKDFRGDETQEAVNLDHVSGESSRKWMGNRRLSVTGGMSCRQPMSYQNLSITYEGEIYNYRKIKQQLKELGHSFETDGDTEVFLHAFKEWDTKCTSKIEGKWSAGIYDSKKDRLYCLRDHFGTKPLYFYESGENFFFSSTIKPILKLRDDRPSENVQAKLDYLTKSLVDHTRNTFFDEIKQLRPGEYLKYSGGETEIRDLPEKDGPGKKNLREICRESIRSKIPEKEYCLSLSGGLDSSIVTAVLADQQPDIYSANIGNGLHESSIYREKLLEEYKLSTDEIQITDDEILDNIERDIEIQEEPTAIIASHAQNILFEKISQDDNKVVITGTGADELFMGYSHFIPQGIVEATKEKGLRKGLDLFFQHFENLSLGDIILIISFFTPFNPLENIGFDTGPERDLVEEPENYTPSSLSRKESLDESIETQLQYFWFPNLLRQTDKNAGSHGLEVREAFLSQDILKYVRGNDPVENLSEGRTKETLRKCFKDILPEIIAEREDKTGFVKPEKSSLSDQLETEMLEKFKSEKFKSRDHINQRKVVETLKNNELEFDMAYRLYSYEVWSRKFIDSE